MLCQLIQDAGSNYIEREGLTKLKYYLDNLERLDPLKSFIDDSKDGLMEAAYFLLAEDSTKTEAILRYIVGHKNVKFNQENIISAAGRSNYIFFKLIEAGGNIHHKSWRTNCTPLHIAVSSKRSHIVKYLLDQNVDVNCYCQNTYTPLHYAFSESHNNLDIIEFLIEKGADMYLCDGNSDTPLECAIYLQKLETVILLLNSQLIGNTVTFDLMKRGFARFCQLCSGNSEALRICFFNIGIPLMPRLTNINYYDFFELLCEKLIQYFVTNRNIREPPLLSIYLNNTIFESNDWANGLKLLLTSEIASTLLEECLCYEKKKKSIFALLIPKLVDARVEQAHRIELLRMLLSLKMVPKWEDMASIFFNYKCNEEFQLLSLALPDNCLLHSYNQQLPMEYIARVFCGLENDLNYNRIFGVLELFEEFSENFREGCFEEFYDYLKQYFTPALSNCSSNANYRNKEMNLPSILSLKELSRNAARKLVKKNKILSPRQFHSAVDSLPIPIKCKNYILLKIKVDEL